MDRTLAKEMVREYLSFVAGIQRTIDENEEEIERCRNMVALTGIRYSDMPRNPNLDTDRIPNAIAALLEAQEAYCEIVDSYTREYQEAFAIFHKPDKPGRSLAWNHYVSGLSWSDIASREGYSESHVRRMVTDALVDAFDDLPDVYKRLPRAL